MTSLQRRELMAVRERLSHRVVRHTGGAGEVWRNIPPQIRTALVMLSLDVPGDAREFARRPWASYTEAQQIELGAIAREFKRDLAEAEALR